MNETLKVGDGILDVESAFLKIIPGERFRDMHSRQWEVSNKIDFICTNFGVTISNCIATNTGVSYIYVNGMLVIAKIDKINNEYTVMYSLDKERCGIATLVLIE